MTAREGPRGGLLGLRARLLRLSGGGAGRVRPARPSTLRVRVTAVASLALTAALVLGVLAMYQLQVDSVNRTVDGQLRTYAVQITQSAHSGPHGSWPRPLPVSNLDSNAEAQVLDSGGRVLAATRTLVGLPPLFTVPQGTTTLVRQKVADRVLPGEIQVLAVRATVDGQPVTIVAGTSTSLLHQVNSDFAKHLLIGLPVILVLAAVTVWLVVKRALRPVEQIRRTVDAITSADLSQRVPEPGTADEIGHLARTMNGMLARLENAAHRQRRFVADASHELRSPLASLRTTLEVGLAHPEKAPWPEIAERAVQQSVRLEDLIRELLLLAKSDERLLAAQQQQVDLRGLLDEIRRSIPARHRLGVEIELTAAGGAAGPTLGNRDHLERLFRNVIDNAVRYARHRVVLTVTAADGSVRVDVDDDGPGIPAEDRERVFDRFVRLDSSRERAGTGGSGTSGLGLAIAREIATAHRGRIAVGESALGGARVTVDLPRDAGDTGHADDADGADGADGSGHAG